MDEYELMLIRLGKPIYFIRQSNGVRFRMFKVEGGLIYTMTDEWREQKVLRPDYQVTLEQIIDMLRGNEYRNPKTKVKFSIKDYFHTEKELLNHDFLMHRLSKANAFEEI